MIISIQEHKKGHFDNTEQFVAHLLGETKDSLVKELYFHLEIAAQANEILEMQRQIPLEKVVLPNDQEPLSREELIEAYKIKKEEELLTLKEMLRSCMKNPPKAYLYMQNYKDHIEDKMWNYSGIDNIELNKRAQEL